MEIFDNPSRDKWPELCRRNIPADDPQVTAAVEQIVADVAARGDKALLEYAQKFDGCQLHSLRMSDDEIALAISKVPEKTKKAIEAAAANIAAFHEAQLMSPIEVETMPGVKCVQRQVPISTVGLYIPGGRAPLFSTVLMLGVPARLAGCGRVVLCTPCNATRGVAPEIVYAACVCGIKEIYTIGGAQAIAAMAYGTDSVPRVDKIFGPGNRFVTKAKQLVSSVVAIDMPAGPSEVMVLADSTANPRYVAADLLSQAEHGPDSQALAVTDSAAMAQQIMAGVDQLKQMLTRKDSVEASLSASRIIVLPSRHDMIDFANSYASEHLIISMSEPWQAAGDIKAAGSVFIGNYSPESAGDYASGTNHTLPTSGWARSYSGVNIDSFCKKITYQQLTSRGLDLLSDTIITMAEAECLDAHALAVKVRLEK